MAFNERYYKEGMMYQLRPSAAAFSTFKDFVQKLHDCARGAANYIELLEAAKPGNR